MPTDPAVTGLSGDRVAMRSIVNRMTDTCKTLPSLAVGNYCLHAYEFFTISFSDKSKGEVPLPGLVSFEYLLRHIGSSKSQSAIIIITRKIWIVVLQFLKIAF